MPVLLLVLTTILRYTGLKYPILEMKTLARNDQRDLYTLQLELQPQPPAACQAHAPSCTSQVSTDLN